MQLVVWLQCYPGYQEMFHMKLDIWKLSVPIILFFLDEFLTITNNMCCPQ